VDRYVAAPTQARAQLGIVMILPAASQQMVGVRVLQKQVAAPLALAPSTRNHLAVERQPRKLALAATPAETG
jgi:hypothetical protein